jgi:hypothetical protein
MPVAQEAPLRCRVEFSHHKSTIWAKKWQGKKMVGIFSPCHLFASELLVFKTTARWRAKKNRSAARVTEKRIGIYISASVVFPITRDNSIFQSSRRKHDGQKDVRQKDGRYFSAQHFSAPNVLTSSTTS